jgi:hypothetical protein
MISKKLLTVGVGVVALSLSLTLAGPANAAQTRTLPAGETLYAIDCQDSNGQLASFDVTTAIGTAIGTGTTDSHVDCAADATFDVATGKVFWAAWSTKNELFSMDPATGESTYIGIVDTAEPTLHFVSALMSGADGVLYVVYSTNDNENDNPQRLGTVDTATGTVTFTHDLLDGGDLLLNEDVWSGDYNPADGKYYVIDNHELFDLDVTTGSLTSQGLNPFGVKWYGLAFDSTGVMWSTGKSVVSSSTIDGWSTVGNQEDSTNDTTIAGQDWYSESNFIIPVSVPAPVVEPTLAATGVNGAQLGLIAAGGAVVALFGAGVAAAGRRRKVTN